MNKKQFDELCNIKNLFGKYFSMVYIAPQDTYVLPQYKGKGIVKATKQTVHLLKDNYITQLETSTGLVEAGITMESVRASYYTSIAHHGFCCFKLDKKTSEPKYYLEIRYKETSDKDHARNKTTSILLDASGKVYPDTILKPKTESERQKVARDIGGILPPKQYMIERIARLSIGGQVFIDPDLPQFDEIMELVLDSNL